MNRAEVIQSWPILTMARRWPFVFLVLLVVLSNVVGSYFNITYNQGLIVHHYLDEAQKLAFSRVTVGFNIVAYGVAMGMLFCLWRPLARARKLIKHGQQVPVELLAACRRRLVNLPLYQVLLTLGGWLSGALVFPIGICLLGGWSNASLIWGQFVFSFVISALLTAMQTFFMLETFLIVALYPEFFAGARPAEVPGKLHLTLGWRVGLLWASTALVPLAALLAVTLSFDPAHPERFGDLRQLAIGVTVVGLPASGLLMWMVARSLIEWVNSHSLATEAIAHGNFAVRIGELRPDEWGQLTDRFNDMASALERGAELRETFGQFINPEVRDEILSRYPTLGGEVETVTVLFADIRSFTQRSASLSPEAAVDLLNRFFSLAVAAVEEQGGWVNKFLGDGILALFGSPRPRPDHAHLAMQAARELLRQLVALNRDLEARGVEPLRVGLGLHTGPALVGCVGASLRGPAGSPRIRREFTAIGETVNLAQRLEGLTKTLGGPILLSASTRSQLPDGAGLEPLGEVAIPGHDGTLAVFRAQ